MARMLIWPARPEEPSESQKSKVVGCLHLTNNREVGCELLVDHKSKDTHHGGTAVVQLNGTLGKLGLLIEGVPAEVDGTVTEVTNEFVSGSLNVLHDAKLKGTNEGKDLGKASLGDGIGAEEGGNTVGEGVKGMTGVVDVSRKVNSVTGHDLAKEGKLADTAVLDLDVTEAVEALLVGIIEQTKGIEEAKRGLGSKLALEGVDGGGGFAGLGRGEGGGRSHKGGESGEFHHG